MTLRRCCSTCPGSTCNPSNAYTATPASVSGLNVTTLAGSSKGRAFMQADLDALAWDVSEHLSDLAVAANRVERATVADTAY